MVAKISFGNSLFGALAYNGEKINKDEGKLLATNRIFDDGTGKVNIRRAMEDFMRFMPDRCRAEKPVVHISLNPHPDDKLTDTDMENIAREYLEKMGFGSQPYMVYKHEDIDRHHMHIVTIRVREDGKAISSSNNFYQSKKATRELEKKYNLHTAERGQAISEIPLRKVNASEGDVKKQIANTVKAVVRGYYYQTLGELRAVLSLYNIDVEETRGIARNREYHGLVYSATDDNGNKVGNPFKASKIGPSVGYEAVQKRFAWSKKQIADKGIAASLKEKILPILATSSNRTSSESHRACTNGRVVREEGVANAEDFKSRLQAQSMDVVFRYTDKGRIYGATFIDHDSRTVLNGSRMCKELSANALEQHFNSPHDQGQTQQGQDVGQTTGGSPFSGADQWQSQSAASSDCDHFHSDFDGFGLFTTDNPAVDPAEEEFRRRMQRKKRKRHGPKR